MDVGLLTIDTRPYHGRVRLTEFLDDPELRDLFEGLDLGSGDRVEIVVKLHRPAVYRDQGVPDFRRHLERQHIYWTGTIRNPRLITVLQRSWHGRDRFKNWIYRRLAAPFTSDPEVEGIVMAMVLGRTYGLSGRVERQFQAAGVYHLIVIAGFHLAVMASLITALVRRFPFGRTSRLLLILATVVVYANLADGHVPVTRAALMVAALIVGRLLDRGYAPGNAVCLAAFILLLMDPMAIRESGFQMTFAAVAAVIGMAAPAIGWSLGWLKEALTQFDDPERDARISPEIADWRVARRLWCELYRLPTWTLTLPWKAVLRVGEILVISLCMEAVFVFFMVESFHRVSLISPLLNVPASLLAGVIIPIALLTIILPAPTSTWVGWLISKLVHLLIAILDTSLRIPAATLRVPSMPVWLWFIYGCGLAALVWAIRSRRFAAFAASAMIVCSLQAGMAFADISDAPAPLPTVTFLDVGQGDSIFLEFPSGKRMLVDGGGVTAGRFLGLRDESTFSIGENVVSPFLWSKGIRKLDVVALTHAHNDHLDGLLDILENFKVGELWLGRNPMVPAYRELIQRALLRQIPIRWLHTGDEIPVSTNRVADNYRFSVLHPPLAWRPKANDQNDDSLVLLLNAGGATALLTGDLTRVIQTPERVDIYKVPHHGSRGVKLQVHSNVRVISVGSNNPFGHPDPSTLPALRTDQLGAITVTLAKPPVVASALTKPSPWYKLATLLEGH
jgi:competence protein ComEC